MNEEIIVGKNAVMEALQSGRPVNKILISERLNQQTVQALKKAMKKSTIPLESAPMNVLNRLTKERHQGIVAYVEGYKYYHLDDLFQRAEKRNEEPFFIILDELEDPHNLGSVLRTADATGAHGVIIPKHRAVGLTATVARVSVGAIEHIPVARVTNIARTIEELKERHVWVVGTDEAGTEDYRELDGNIPIALVIGNEGKGITRIVKEKCDWTVRLPMAGKVSSLNASVACGLLLYEVYRKRHPIGEA